MTLSDKITEERKKKGWSQEELAYKLGVSRQAVSKWESAGSVPDLQRIIQLADLFGVSTDYLLRDDRTQTDSGSFRDSEPRHYEYDREKSFSVDNGEYKPISAEEAGAFLEMKRNIAGRITNGVSMCVVCPAVLIVLTGMADEGLFSVSENFAVSVGIAFLLCLVAAAVFIFIRCAGAMRETEYLEKEDFETEYGVTDMVRGYKREYRSTYNGGIAIGTVLCILSAVPLILAGIAENSPDYIYFICLGILLAVVAVGVNIIIRVAVINNSFNILLQEGEFTADEKRVKRKIDPWSGIYWGLVTALYLILSFKDMRWDTTWVIWPVARLLFGVFYGIVRILAKREK